MGRLRSMNQEKTSSNKGRRSLIMLLLAFALPIIIAKLALENGWLDYGVTNKGELLSGDITLESIGLSPDEFEKHWLIVYTLPEQCGPVCEQTLESVHNTYVALGRERTRVEPVLLTPASLNNGQVERIGKSRWQVINMTASAKNILSLQKIYIVDPLGNILMSHQPPSQSSELNAFGKKILADMKK